MGSGNFGSQNPYIFHKKQEQILASFLQKQELTKTVTSDNHFLISVFINPSIFSQGFCGQQQPQGFMEQEGREGKGREREKGIAEGREAIRGNSFKGVCP